MTLQAPASPGIDAAYAECERITRQQAKNFAYGIALLPRDKRHALSAVYAFARRVDDIGDGTLPTAKKIAALRDTRAAVESLAAGKDAPADDLVLVALADAARRFPIPLSAFGELIDGCEADVHGVIYTTFADLEHYCRCVAGSIGRLSLGVFGSSDTEAAPQLADSLGVALQLTNILRDIREDLGNQRVYLPAADLAQFGCTLMPGDTGGTIAGPMDKLIRFEASRAREWYATGMRLMPLLDRRSGACTGAMAGIYRRLLEHIAARPAEALAHRMSLPTREKAVIAAAALAGMGRRRQPAWLGRGARTGPAATTAKTPGELP
ncbi:MAG TPA: presqualene diphosphate synthase HpnD [Streptosporangiaceae bacterium]